MWGRAVRGISPVEASSWMVHSLGRDKVVGGMVLAVLVREGSEAEARRAVGSLLV